MVNPIKREGKSVDGKAYAFATWGGEESANYLEEIFSGTDRVMVIVGVAYLENLLKEVLSCFLVKDNEIQANVFDPLKNGALHSFTPKVDLAFLLGFISKETRELLKKLAEIRNIFAHRHNMRTFEDLETDKEIGKSLDKVRKRTDGLLRKSQPTLPENTAIPARGLFIICLTVLEQELRVTAIKAKDDARTQREGTFSGLM